MTAQAPSRKRGRPRNEQAEAAILDAALGVLADHGYAGLTVEAVAARAGVAKTTVYRRWPGKGELLVDALTTVKHSAGDLPGGSVADDLKWLMERMRRAWTSGDHGKIMRRLSAEGNDQPELYRMFCDRVVAPRRALVRSILQRGVDEGVIRDDVDLDDVIDMLSAPTIVSVMTLREKITRRQVEFVIDTVLAGIAPRSGRIES
jgi:AcrR family transcriptional regulator